MALPDVEQKHVDCQTVGVCDAKHELQDERWSIIQEALKKWDARASTMSGLAYTLLGGMIISLILLLVNLVIMSNHILKTIP